MASIVRAGFSNSGTFCPGMAYYCEMTVRRRQKVSTSHRSAILVATALFFGLAVTAHADGSLQLGLPLDCTPGVDCWVVNNVDLDSSDGARDFMCRRHTYDDHKGTDFAVRDLQAMGKGVPVRASAAGTVAGVRDGMPDISVALVGREALGGRECGNGMVIRHSGGWETQYCHLRQGSVLVSPGDVVESGAQLGLVGQSGWAEFPHVHISVRHDGQIVDPFSNASPKVGGAPCVTPGAGGVEGHGLWREGVFGGDFYERTSIYHVGFSGVVPNVEAIRAGLFDGIKITPTAPVLAFWADVFWVEKGDHISLRLIKPDGTVLIEHFIKPEKNQARHWVFAGKKRKTARWPAGSYIGEITVSRTTEDGTRQSYQERRELVIP